MKKILTAEQLVEDMERRGIRFTDMLKGDAIEYLKSRNYYMNVASYRANYVKCESGDRQGEYQNLDFAYLVELSEIDTELKRILFSMCLDIERAIKTQIVTSISEQDDEDGYNVMRAFLNNQKDLGYLVGIRKQADKNIFCHDLIDKHYPYFPLWVFVELISFGTLIFLYSFFGDYYQEDIVDNKLMNVVRDVRNAAAHNNCIMNQILSTTDSTKQPSKEISDFVKANAEISKTSRRNNLKSAFSYSIVTLLYVYKSVVPEEIAIAKFKELQAFINGRVCENANYFRSNSKLCSTYTFFKKLVDNLCL